MHAIIFIRLDTHVPGAKVFDASFACLQSSALFEELERFVALGDDELVGFERAGGGGGDEEAGE